MRRNRIKAVINVPRGRSSTANHSADRPITPLTPSISSPSTQDPSSPAASYHHTRSPSPLVSPPLNISKYTGEYTLGLVRSPPAPPSKIFPHLGNPTKSVGSGGYGSDHDRPTTPSEHGINYGSSQFPISPGGIHRPSPSASPRYIPHNSPQPQRPSPAPSPNNNKQLTIFNSNSNSADSHEVARFMSLPSPGGIFSARTPEESHQNRSQTSTPTKRAFSSISTTNSMRDPANSIVNNSELLRQRLSKPSPTLTVTKYHTLRKEFLSKGNHNTPERQQLTMLHFAFWNPPKKDKDSGNSRPSSRNSRASSVCSDHGPSTEVDFKLSVKAESTKSVAAGRRITVRDIPITTPPIVLEYAHSQSSTTSSVQIDTPKEKESVANIGPRVKVGPDGQLIIDEQSLVVETSESKRAKKQLSEMETVSGADFVVGSSGLFRNKKNCRRGHDWTDKETIKFYKALNMCGTDFSMMTTLFPSRTRAELKAKFKREDRKNPGQISSALTSQEFDMEAITSSEDEDDQSKDTDLIIEGTKLKRTRKKRNRYSKPLTEIERRLHEELEEMRAMYSTDAGSSTTPTSSASQQPQFKNLAPIPPSGSRKEDAENNIGGKPTTTKRKRGKKSKPKEKQQPGGRSTTAWKSSVIIDDVSGNHIPESSTKSSHNAVPLPLKKRKRQSRKKKQKISMEDLIAAQNPPHPEIAEDDETPINSRSVNSIDILRFDHSDPLGLKVVLPSTSPTPAQSEGGLSPTSSISEDLISLTPVKELPPPTADTTSASRNRRKTSPRLPPPKVKALPFRVPGPGPLNPPSPVIVDEIEIEISCQ